MNRTLTFILGVLAGLLVGGALTFWYVSGVPRSAKVPGQLIQAPDPGGSPPGTAQIVLRQDFFNEVLNTIFRDMNAPSFPLNLAGQNTKADPSATTYGLLQASQCDSKISLQKEGSGVQTGLRLENGKIAAPLAFSGSTSVLGTCIPFAGWAQANLDLRFDAESQAVFGQVNVETVNLDGISPLISGFVTPLVQSTLNQRVNPIQILRGEQIALKLPIAAANGTMQARVTDVRSEVKDNALNLYVIYSFTGQPAS